MHSIRLILSAALFCTALFTASGKTAGANAQTLTPDLAIERSSSPRKKIGLALSGGGARGGAHVGVLSALRELRIPIDYIAGTSMGSVVGGLYASGITGAMLEDVIHDTEWRALFSDTPPRTEESFRRKQDHRLFLLRQRLGFRDGDIQLPLGAIQGQRMDVMLSRLTLPAVGVNNFDNLQIPFRAIATDIVTGEAVVLGRGNLARAIRASLSIPAIIAPIEIDGRLLVDGGIAMNLPVEVVRAMGADIIIAVDVSTPLHTREDIRSAIAITGQLSGFLTRGSTEAQIAQLSDDDVLIVPQLDGLASADFSRIEETLALGYEATMAKASELMPLALDAVDYRAHRQARSSHPSEALPSIDFVRLDNQSKLADNVIYGRIGDLVTDGGPVDITAIEKAIARIYGLQLFQNVRYEVVTEGPSTGLEIQVQDRSWGPNYLQFGIEYSSTTDHSVFGLNSSYLRTEINRNGGEWRSGLTLGEEQGLFTELYQPLGERATFFFHPSLTLEESVVSLYEDGDRVAELAVPRAEFSLAAGRELGMWGEWRIGILRSTGDVDVRVGNPSLRVDDQFHEGMFFTRLSVDTLDNVHFPTAGTAFRAEWRASRESLGADEDFDQFIANASATKSWGRHTFTGGIRFNSTRSGKSPVQNLPRIGGFFDLSGFNQNELSGQHVGRLLGAYYRRIGDIALLPAYTGATIEIGNAWNSRAAISLDNSIVAGSVWIGADTPIGAAYLGYGTAEGGISSIYVRLGSLF